MTTARTLAGLLALALASSGAATAQEATEGGTVSLGMLTCHMSGDTNLVVFSKESFACTYRTTAGETAPYHGAITKIGADLEFKSGQTLKWAVLAPSALRGAGILGGTYVGASAEATLGVGVGGKVLIGGSSNQIILQPISVSGQTGGGASLTLDGLRLQAVAG